MKLEKKKYFLCPMCGEKLKLPKTEELEVIFKNVVVDVVVLYKLEMAIIFHLNEVLKKYFKN